MRGTKRFAAASDSAQDTNDAVFRSKRVMGGPSLDGFRPEMSQTQDRAELPPLDENDAELSRQHVRALNSQFASWVQMQLKNHPDELWEDGVRDYLTHASSIMEKFSDVVSWLRANASKGGSAVGQKKLVSGTVGENKLSHEKAVFNPTLPTKSVNFSSTWASGGAFPSNQSSGGGLLSNTQSSSLFSSGPGSGLFSGSQSSAQNASSQSLGLFSNESTSMFSNSRSPGMFSPRPTFGLSSSNQSSGALSGSQTSGSLFNSQSSGAFSNSQSSGVFSNSQSSGISFNARAPILFGQSAVTADRNPQDDANDDDELSQPGSPSVKKSEEKGIVVVHEVKCKLYVKSSDPSDKDTWKDRGTGQLSIKCVEGISKGTKESKPNIIIRNEVGKVLLNALLYPGIKTNASKNSIVAIFHTAIDDGSENSAIVARTFLIRTKTEEDRNKLASAIQEYAPAS